MHASRRLGIALVLALTGVAWAASEESEQERIRVAHYREYAAGISALTTRVESYIAQELVKKQGLCEYPPARHYAMRDLDGDNQADLLVITTFELPAGGNNYESHFFAVLTSRPEEIQHLVVGGRGSRDAEGFRDSGQALFLQFRVWAKTDAQCCPSLTSTEQVCLENGRVLLKPFDEIKRKAPGW